MGLFDRFRKPEPAARDERPSLIVALDAWTHDPRAAKQRLEPLTARKVAVDLEADDKVLSGHVTLGAHEVRMVGFDVPVPKPVMEKTVECSAWQGPPRERLLGHRAHLILFHESGGEDTADRLTALYQIAGALGGEHLAGAIHESAWTCAPAEVVRDFLDFDKARELRESTPPILYFGVLPFTQGEAAWVATRGCHLFGVPDLVIERGGNSNSELFRLLHNLFVYLSGGAKVAPGHTMQTDEKRFFRFRELPADHEHYEWLKGAGATLELVRIQPDEANPAHDHGR
ncbi:MAG: hypothetical protein K8I27_03225 [Planctomycetes bacterium]|nr:hypothetical protein [Planctomycetota bacterium]